MFEANDGEKFADEKKRDLHNAILDLYWMDQGSRTVRVNAQAWENFLNCFESLYDVQDLPEGLR